MKTYVSIQLSGRNQTITLCSEKYMLQQANFRSPAKAIKLVKELLAEGAEMTTDVTYKQLLEWQERIASQF
jgi:hypothetical protein